MSVFCSGSNEINIIAALTPALLLSFCSFDISTVCSKIVLGHLMFFCFSLPPKACSFATRWSLLLPAYISLCCELLLSAICSNQFWRGLSSSVSLCYQNRKTRSGCFSLSLLSAWTPSRCERLLSTIYSNSAWKNSMSWCFFLPPKQ